jgi:hypothetical protein
MELKWARGFVDRGDSSNSETEEPARVLTTKDMAEAFQHL